MADKGWVNEIYGITVEHRLIPRPGGKPLIPIAKTGIWNPHTTEGMGIDAAWAALNAKHAAPHFITGDNRIIQCRPIGMQGAALLGGAATNGRTEVQTEICAFSKQTIWQLVPASYDPTVKLMAYLKSELHIPLIRPAGWPDDCADMKGEIWASANNSRRLSGKFNAVGAQGIFQHLEIPLNNHWDCGCLNWTELIAAANKLVDGDCPEPPKPDLPHIPAPQPTLRRGDTEAQGKPVKALQANLARLGLLSAREVDGSFGPVTESAVKQFQFTQHLTQDGIYGKNTAAALAAS